MKQLLLCLSIILLSACSGGSGSGGSGSGSAVIPTTDVTLNKPDNTSTSDNNAGNNESTQDVATATEKPVHEQPESVETTANNTPSVVQPLPDPVIPDMATDVPDYEAINVVGDDNIFRHSTPVNYDNNLKEAQQKFDTVLIKIKGTDVEVLARSPEEVTEKKEISLLNSTVNKFIDANGQLVGYYGKATTITTENHRSGYAEDVKYRIDNMFYAIDKNQSHLPEINANYQGVFYYYYGLIPREATVAINYNDRKITGDIIGKGNNHHWKIDNKNNNVEDDGTFFVRLTSKSKDDAIKNGVLNGGFYGKQGEFVVGEAYNDQNDTQWAGVIGASRVEE